MPLQDANPTPSFGGFGFRDWVIEQTSTPWAVAEAALAHNVGNSTEAAYMRSDLFGQRRALMDAWAAYVNSESNKEQDHG